MAQKNHSIFQQAHRKINPHSCPLHFKKNSNTLFLILQPPNIAMAEISCAMWNCSGILPSSSANEKLEFLKTCCNADFDVLVLVETGAPTFSHPTVSHWYIFPADIFPATLSQRHFPRRQFPSTYDRPYFTTLSHQMLHWIDDIFPARRVFESDIPGQVHWAYIVKRIFSQFLKRKRDLFPVLKQKSDILPVFMKLKRHFPSI